MRVSSKRLHNARVLNPGRWGRRYARSLSVDVRRQSTATADYRLARSIGGMSAVSVRVVLVDDIAEYRSLVRIALRSRGGFDVVGEAADGRTAVDVVKRHRPDVVVLDLGLPDLPGREVISQLRDVAPATRVIVFTGTDIDDLHNLRSQVEGYVLKNADLDVLINLLTGLAERNPAQTAALHLARDLRSAADARRFVTAFCAEWECAAVVDDALLVVSELVANAVTHAATDCDLRLLLSSARLRIEVEDSGAGSPDLAAATTDDERGRGLFLVSALSTAWGVDSVPNQRKRVWADLQLAPTP